jgi:hypothetical protein
MRVAVIAFWLLATLLVSSTQVKSSPPSQVPAFLYTSAARYEALAWMTGHDRFPSGARVFIEDERGRRPLVPEFAASADPSVSFDGTRVLFAGKQRAGDSWQIWELALTDSTVRQVSRCRQGCVRPLYVPGDSFTYAEYRNKKLVIMLGSLTTGKSFPLSYAPGNFLPTDVLRDGRILFEAMQPFGANSSSDIYAVYSDGSGVESYRCDHGARRHSGKQMASGDIVFVHGRGLGRFTSALAHELRVPVLPGEYAGDVVELPNGDWLLAWRAAPDKLFSIVRWEPGSARFAPVVQQESNLIQPTLLVARPAPNRHPSALHDWSYANLLGLNAYTSKDRFQSGSAALVRLYSRQPSGAEKLLGEAPVEADGSFYLRTPADQALRIELLNSARKSLRKEAGWFWLRRGEQRVCVGCHAGPETSPENAVPAVLLRSTTPADMTGTATTTAGAH